MNSPHILNDEAKSTDADSVFETHYTPRQVKRKIIMLIAGLLILGYGWSELSPPLSLLFKGHYALAEATRVIKTKAGLPDQIFTDDLHLQRAEDKHDRSYVFWNEFHFVTENHTDCIVRFDIGSQLKPLFPLLDSDGLPTTVQIYYDPQDPKRICIPMVLSTWFAPGLIAFMGLICLSFGCLILYWSNHRIELP